MRIRMLGLDDLGAFVELRVAHARVSGRGGEPYHGPYGRDEPLDPVVTRERTRVAWTRPLAEPEWRRAWGAYEGDDLVGTAELTGGALAAERHRVRLGMGVTAGHRRRGHGRRLLEAAVAWCRGEPSIAWLDLGVFADNASARALYEAFGFETVGTFRDRWRVDGVRVDDVSMTLNVEERP